LVPVQRLGRAGGGRGALSGGRDPAVPDAGRRGNGGIVGPGRGQRAAAGRGESVNIGAASQASGVSQRMIRHYEKIGLVPAPARRESGYRDYGEADVHCLRFIANARDLGFPIEEIRTLLGLWSD